jgi:UDP-glucuronate 4-epimerase
MKILVTGAAGFIGSHCVDRLLSEGHEVIGLDNFDSFYPREIKDRNLELAKSSPLFTLVEADIRSRDSLSSVSQEISGIDAIIHLAAKAGVRPSIEDPMGYQETNVKGTQNLLELARESGIKQFVFASSSSVYGVNPNVPWSESDTGLKPISPYASTKVSGELMGHVYSHLYGIRFIALRFFTVYGPRQRPDLAIHKFARMILAGKPIPIFGDGRTRRDYTYVSDTVDGIVGALHYSASPFEVINLGNQHTVSLAEMVETIERALGVQALRTPLPEQPGDVPQTWADITKAQSLLGYHPTTSFPDGFAKFLSWLRGTNLLAPR